MKRGCNFWKLKGQNNNEGNKGKQSGGPSNNNNHKQQTTISKFFHPKNSKETTFDKLLGGSEVKGTSCSAKSINGDDDDDSVVVLPVKRPKNDGGVLSSSTLDKLRSFSNAGGIDVTSPVKKSKNAASLLRSKHFKGSPPKPVEEAGERPNGNVANDDGRTKNAGSKKTKPFDASKNKYTPLEKQFMEIKEKHPETVLFVECGYKFRFFGEDAEIAAKELNIQCWLDHNFMTGSIPTYRLFVHIRRLVSKGYKVGVVKQIETASIKAAGENKHQLFERKLTALYTKSTLIGEDVEPPNDFSESSDVSENQQSHCLIALCEHKAEKTAASKTFIALVSVNIVTGRLTYDYFEDNAMRGELDSRLAHLQPVELIRPVSDLSVRTERLLEHWSKLERVNDDDRLRIEKREDGCFDYSKAIETVTASYERLCTKNNPLDIKILLDLPKAVICCLSSLIIYLEEFSLDRALCFSRYSFSHYSSENKSLKLDASTLRNLEIFKNISDGKVYGTLFWVLNHTSTPFGCRLLRKWISRPLQDIKLIEERQEIVTELMVDDNYFFSALKALLKKLPDLEKGLGTIYQSKCSPSLFHSTASGLVEVLRSLRSYEEYTSSNIKSPHLLKLLNDTMSSLSGVEAYVANLNDKAIREGDKTRLFKDWSPFPAVVDRQAEIQAATQKLKDLKPSIRQALRLPGFDYVTVSNQEYLIEVRNTNLKQIPKDWAMISSTKQVSRYHSPEIIDLLGKLNWQREHLNADCANAWMTFLSDFNNNFYQFLQAVENLAAIDCFFSFGEIAKQPGYCRPFMVEHSTVINVEGGRHPVTSLLLPGNRQYVPNDTHLEVDKERCMIITGPNMGGKSSYIRQVGMIILMAHVGSYVPADAATIGIIDAIFTRMGSRDELCGGQSTFMVEMEETRHIMKNSTSRSLVILDELGRGTSTFDGVAIAQAVLNFFLTKVHCLTMFVTHYTILSEFEKQFPTSVGNYHLSFLVNEHDDDNRDELEVDVVTFMYRVTKGAAANSYGLNVARLAEVPTEVVQKAKQKSQELEEKITLQRDLSSLLMKLWNKSADLTSITDAEFNTMEFL